MTDEQRSELWSNFLHRWTRTQGHAPKKEPLEMVYGRFITAEEETAEEDGERDGENNKESDEEEEESEEGGDNHHDSSA